MRTLLRSFLALVVTCSLVAAGCGGDDSASSSPGPGGRDAGASGAAGESGGGAGGMGASSYDAFDAFREMQGALRQSPDHLPARAAALVASKDARGLFELVRDDVATIPGRDGFYRAGSVRRFGARATLRGAMGTMRERADLLRDLLEQAGFRAEVWVGQPEPHFDLEALVARPANRIFAPKSTAAERKLWASVLPELPANFSVAPLDAGGEIVGAVHDRLLAASVSAAQAEGLSWEIAELPFVRATIGGATVDLNPNVPDAAYGESHAVDPTLAPEADALDTVTVRLSIARATDPGTDVPLVEKTWNADELVGRTVTAAFVTPYSFIEAAATRADVAQTFIPVLEVKGADLGDAAAQKLSAVGDAVTRGGQRIVLDDDGALLFGDARIPLPPSDPARLAAVKTLETSLETAAFPEVSVLVALANARGERVDGLAADAFRVEEDGRPVEAVLRRTEPPPPRVVLLFDRSSSLPPEFLDDAAATGHRIAEELFSAVPEAQIQIAGMDFGGPTVAGPYATSLLDVDAQLAELHGAASELWQNLQALSLSDATLVIAISDFVAEDSLTTDVERALADGPPVLAVAVGQSDGDAADRVVELTTGARFDATDAAGVAATAAEFVASRQAYGYRLVYRAERDGTAPRDVRVTFDSERIAATANYTPPESPAPMPAISGIFLTVSTSGREVKRLIAGAASAPLSEDAIEQADAMLFGRVVLGVEAGPPSLSVKLDEHVGERLRLEPAVDAALARDRDRTLRALQASRSRTPANLRFAFAASPDEANGPATYPDGLSTALYVERPIWNLGVRRSLDWLSLVPRRTALRDPAEAFDVTLRRTAYLSAIEAKRFPQSTYSLLAKAPLAVFDPLTIDAELGAEWYDAVTPYPGRIIVAPKSGAPLAFYAVDPATGDVIGGLPDSTGGAVAADIEATLQRIETLLSLAERAGAMGGFNGISVWTQLERTKAQIVGAVTVLFGEGGEPDIGDILSDAASGAIEDGITGEIPGWDEATEPIEDLGDIYDTVETITGNEMPDIDPPSIFP